MHLDVKDLRNFYYRSTLGRAAQKAVRDYLVQMWPNATGETMVGFGFAVPLLRPYMNDARRITGLMPAPQGVMPWPTGLPNMAVLCEEVSWPVDTGHVDRLVVMHGLETSEQPSALLDECFRVLGPGGRAIFIVPNRAGLWSRSDRTPFGYGRPYTLGQLEAQLRQHHFSIERHEYALFQPPSQRRFWRKAGQMIEQLGHSIPKVAAGGVIMVEVSKRIQALSGPGLRETVSRPLQILTPNPSKEVAPI